MLSLYQDDGRKMGVENEPGNKFCDSTHRHVLYVWEVYMRISMICVFMGVMVSAHISLHVRRHADNLRCWFSPSTLYETGSFLFITAYTKLAGLQASDNSLVYTAHSYSGAMKLQTPMLLHLGFHMGSGDPNSGYQAFEASTLPTESTPQSLPCFWWEITIIIVQLILFVWEKKEQASFFFFPTSKSC